MANWEYIIVQGYRTVDRQEIGPVSELMHEERVTTINEATSLKDTWTADGFTVSMAGKVVGEDGERLVTST